MCQTFDMIILLIIGTFTLWINGCLGILLFIILSFYTSYFRNHLVKIKAFVDVSRSPIYSHLNNTISGLIPIRAF